MEGTDKKRKWVAMQTSKYVMRPTSKYHQYCPNVHQEANISLWAYFALTGLSEAAVAGSATSQHWWGRATWDNQLPLRFLPNPMKPTSKYCSKYCSVLKILLKIFRPIFTVVGLKVMQRKAKKKRKRKNVRNEENNCNLSRKAVALI